MRNWARKIKVRHLFTENEDHTSIQSSMNSIANVLERSKLFDELDFNSYKNIPQGDDFFAPVDYANKLLDEMYDVADYKSIWIE